MKNWNAAEIVELNIAETANGILPWCKEFCIITNDGLSNNNNNNNSGSEDGTEEGKGDNSTTETLS